MKQHLFPTAIVLVRAPRNGSMALSNAYRDMNGISTLFSVRAFVRASERSSIMRLEDKQHQILIHEHGSASEATQVRNEEAKTSRMLEDLRTKLWETVIDPPYSGGALETRGSQERMEQTKSALKVIRDVCTMVSHFASHILIIVLSSLSTDGTCLEPDVCVPQDPTGAFKVVGSQTCGATLRGVVSRAAGLHRPREIP